MKLIIAGGRDYWGSFVDALRLNILNKRTKVTEVVSGKARGADTCGENWAISLDIPIKEFRADWDKYGTTSGMRSNFDLPSYRQS